MTSAGPSRRLRELEGRIADGFARRRLVSVRAGRLEGAVPLWSRLSCWLVVLPLHLFTVGCLGVGLWWVVAEPNPIVKVVGVVLVCAAFVTRPRVPGEPPSSGWVDRQKAPHTFALLDAIAACTKGPVPNRLLVFSRFNAFAARVGWRRRAVVGIGAPLWVALSPQAKVAVLGHELGHLAHRDAHTGWWVGTAENALHAWRHLLGADDRVSIERLDAGFVETYLLAPFRGLVLVYLGLISWVAGPASQRQEYHADLDSARVAGTSGGVRMLEVLLFESAVDTAIVRASVATSRPDVWQTVRDAMAVYDEAAYVGRRQLVEMDRNRIDDSHPLTALRIELLETLPAYEPLVELDPEWEQRIEAELAPCLARAAKVASERVRYAR